MVFTELRFFIFLLITIIFFIFLKNHRKYVLFIASIIFYIAWDYRFLGLLLFTSIFAFFIWKQINSESRKNIKKYYLFIWIFVHIAILFVFKYFNFFLDSIWNITSNNFDALNIILPLWISFFTFQAISYIIDIYKQKIKVETNLFNFVFYIIFFPQLIAWPIVRASQFLDQIDTNIIYKPKNLLLWWQIFLIWLFKKLVIADNLSFFVDKVYSEPLLYDTLTNWMALLSYTFQLFYDFSAYSDMAIWIALLFWLTLPKNFNFPYLSNSITDFWRRWHITLSNFVKDYLYIPLWWNKCSKLKQNINLLITMTICWIWHWAWVMYILWWFYHWILLVIDKYIYKYKSKINNNINIFITFLLVMLWWAIFRSENVFQFMEHINRLFSFESKAIFWPFTNLFILLPIIIIHHIIYLKKKTDYILWKWKSFSWLFILIFFIFSIFLFQSTGIKPFLYFQF